MEIFIADHIENGVVVFGAEESAHCVRVLRHRAGDEIFAIDGHGTGLRCILEDDSPKGASARIIEEIPSFGSHPYRLTMAVCPTKNSDRYEWFAEKATEIGVDTIVPVIGQRSERKTINTQRLSRLLCSAAKQSLKGAVPELPEPVSVKEFILSVSGRESEATARGEAPFIKIICHCMESERRFFSDILRGRFECGAFSGDSGCNAAKGTPGGNATGSNTGIRPDKSSSGSAVSTSGADGSKPGITKGTKPEIFVLIGPEGDFSPEEAALALQHGWIPASLGDSRLRTETAALVATTLVYALHSA
ncbi:MAG: 16S rRNA (uracil(1498)-N(3))-methyltransferase [Bacteroidales bacterium]|nr:16S rRNA (uracil(1498)-N(3))-methyltransferase [Bacteroidales bacterium]